MLNWLYTWLGLSNASGAQYLAWSGVIPALCGFTFIFGAFHYIRNKNCHVKGCWSLHTAPDPKHGWNACKNHHSLGHMVGRSHHE